MSEEEIKYHYYALSFTGKNNEGQDCSASSYIGYVEKKVTLKNLNEARKYLEINENAVVMGISYMGYMTENEVRYE